MVTMPGGLAEFERDLIHMRTSEGHARKGARRGAWPQAEAHPHQRRQVRERLAKGEAQADIAGDFNIGHSTISRMRPEEVFV